MYTAAMLEDAHIGFIGLGNMGLPTAKNLIDAGYDLLVHDVREEPLTTLREYGAKIGETPALVAQQSDVVITFLPEPKHVREVTLGDDGILESTDKDLVHIDMSTIGPSAHIDISSELEKEGIKSIDAPVSGGVIGAKNATMTIMIGGDEELVERFRDLFETVGGKVTYVGGRGAGQTAKICNNMIASAAMTSLAEALVFAEKAGVSQHKLIDAIEDGGAQSWALDNRSTEMIEKDFEPGFFGSYMYKDLRLALEGAEDFGVVAPVTSINHELYKSMEEKGRGKLDSSGVITVLEDLSGLNED